MILPLIQNMALLVALTALYRSLLARYRHNSWPYQAGLGLISGVVGVIGMMTPLNLLPGIFFDGRIIVLSVAGMFGGPLTALIAALMCGGYRLWVGGGGALVGISTVVEAAAIGTAFYYLRRRANGRIPLSWMWGMGITVTLVELVLFLGLPQGAGLVIIRELGLLIMVMYPAATALMCSLLQDADFQIQDREALRAREAALQKAQDLAQLGSWKWLIPHNRLELSEQLYRVLQLSPQNYSGGLNEFIEMLADPEDGDKLLHLQQEMVSRRAKSPVEICLRLPAGSERILWVEPGDLITDAAGHPHSITGIMQDITARRQAEEKVRSIEARYRILFESSPDALYINHQERVLMVNPAGVRLFGAQSEDELIGKDVFELYHPDYHDIIRERIRSMMELGGSAPVIEEKIVRLDGSVVTVDAIAVSIVTEHGNDIQVILRDVSDRLRMEAALRESHEMLANIAEQAPGVVYQYLLYPDGRSCFPWASDGIRQIYEVTPEEVRHDATPVFGRLHPEDHDHVAALIYESARTLKLFHAEFRVVLPNQGLRWRLSNATPQRTEDGGTLWYGIIVDDTERKLAEQKISAQLEELRRWRSVMIGREKRNIELKKEINELLRSAGQPPRYSSVEDEALEV